MQTQIPYPNADLEPDRLVLKHIIHERWFDLYKKWLTLKKYPKPYIWQTYNPYAVNSLPRWKVCGLQRMQMMKLRYMCGPIKCRLSEDFNKVQVC